MKKSMVMRVTPVIAASLALAWLLQPPAPARAAGAPTPHYSVDRFTIGALLANPRTRAILDEYLHGFSAARIAVKGRDETLREVQPFDSSRLTNTVLARINAALAKISATGHSRTRCATTVCARTISAARLRSRRFRRAPHSIWPVHGKRRSISTAKR